MGYLTAFGLIAFVVLGILGGIATIRGSIRRDQMFERLIKEAKTEEERDYLRKRW